ncbi:MAG TPA: hypothetical protein VFE96_04095 [Candidatus Bathyarchaeia archaeon]|nr:hypothetical protein [Candidatus Bathyarchaeia archaeon]
MDPIIFEFIGGLLVGAMVFVTVLFRPRRPSANTMPMLAIRTRRTASSERRRPTLKKQNKMTAKTEKKARRKETRAVLEPSQVLGVNPVTASFDTCPSCGLQAPGNLLAEHFLGSPSHKNGPLKVVAEPAKTEREKKTEEDDSTQSVRNLLQMLVPPRAFGHRHEQRSVDPVASVVKEIDPHRGRIR